jgi:hypothetical protein
MKRLMGVATLGVLFLGLALGACAPQKPPLGSEQNPLVMVFVPSGESEEIKRGASNWPSC